MGGASEVTVLRLIDVQLAFPYILLAIAITSAVEPSVPLLILLMALAGWAGAARVVRSVALQERGKDYVLAAELVGADRVRIARRYVFPSVRPSVLVLAPLQMSAMIVFEATLSFLGMGVKPPTPTWGGMMLEGKVYLSYRLVDDGAPGALHLRDCVGPDPHRRGVAAEDRAEDRRILRHGQARRGLVMPCRC